MSALGRILLIGGAAFVGWELWKNMSTPAAPAPTAPGGIQPASSPTPTTVAPLFNPGTTAALILNKAGSSFTLGSPDEWGYYWNEARGPNSAPDPVADLGFTQETRLQKMTFPEYWALATSKGFSGIIPTRGVGYIRAPRLALMTEL